MQRDGVTLKKVPAGSPRRLADMKNGWRKASAAQRVEMMDWIQHGAPDDDNADDIAANWVEPPKG